MSKPTSMIIAVIALLSVTALAISKTQQEPRYKLGIQYRPAMVVTVVEPDSIAERHGLLKGDVVLEIGDREPESALSFAQAVGKGLEELGSIKLEVLRTTPEGTKHFTLTIAR